MSLVTATVFDGGLERGWAPGDVLNAQEVVQSIANAAGVTWTAQQLLTGILDRSGAAAVSDTTPDASSIVNAMLGQAAYAGTDPNTQVGVQAGSSFRLQLLNRNSGTLTLVAGAGVSLVAGLATTAATGSGKTYLVTVTNGTPPQTFAGTTTNASAVITGLSAAQTAKLSPGMNVSGTGIPASTTVLSVQPGVGVTLSANATATGNLVALAFTPAVSIRALN